MPWSLFTVVCITLGRDIESGKFCGFIVSQTILANTSLVLQVSGVISTNQGQEVAAIFTADLEIVQNVSGSFRFLPKRFYENALIIKC